TKFPPGVVPVRGSPRFVAAPRPHLLPFPALPRVHRGMPSRRLAKSLWAKYSPGRLRTLRFPPPSSELLGPCAAPSRAYPSRVPGQMPRTWVQGFTFVCQGVSHDNVVASCECFPRCGRGPRQPAREPELAAGPGIARGPCRPLNRLLDHVELQR